jgi:hypothetical protein
VAKVPAKVESALVAFFRTKCPEPAEVTKLAHVRSLCGYYGVDAWRSIVPLINDLPALRAARLRLDPATLIDSCATVVEIKERLSSAEPPPAGEAVTNSSPHKASGDGAPSAADAGTAASRQPPHSSGSGRPTGSAGRPARVVGHGSLSVVLLLAAFAMNVLWAPTNLFASWITTVALTSASVALIGLACGRWEATFIDNRNRMSLSKLQVILWTVVVLSSILSASCFNAADTGDISKIIGIAVDPTLWGLLGISVTTAVGAPLALSGKGDRTVFQPELDDTKKNLAAITGVPSDHLANDGHLLVKAHQSDARFSDLIRGDDVGNGDTIDFSKVQQLYFTLLTLLIFGLAVAKQFITSAEIAVKLAAHQAVFDANNQKIIHAVINQLPTPDPGFLGLLAASGAGYLFYKAMSHSKDG